MFVTYVVSGKNEANGSQYGEIIVSKFYHKVKKGLQTPGAWLKLHLTPKRYQIPCLIGVNHQHSMTKGFISSRATLNDTLMTKNIGVLS